MTTITITSSNPRNPRRYARILEALGVKARIITPEDRACAHEVMDGAGGLLLPGGPDVDPVLYKGSPDPSAGLNVCRPLDDLDLRLLAYALERDMPVLAICRGMQLLNVAFGGSLIQDRHVA